MAINGFVFTKMNFNQISEQRWVNCYRNHDVYCALMLYMYTYLFVLNLTILNSWVSLYSLMSTTLPKEWRKTGQQTSLIFKIHHSKISSLENFLKFTSLDHLGPTQVKYVEDFQFPAFLMQWISSIFRKCLNLICSPDL